MNEAGKISLRTHLWPKTSRPPSFRKTMSTTGWVTRISAPTPQYAGNMCGTLPDIKSARIRRLSPPPTSTLADHARFSTPASSRASRITWAASLDTVLLDL